MEHSKEFGKKLVDKAIAGKIGHRIAVIGNEVFGALYDQGIESHNYTVELYKIEDFYKLDRLVNFTLCIVGYDAFTDENNQTNFIKQMLEAIDHGVNFCVVYYKEHFSNNRGSSRQNLGYQISTKLNLFPTNLDQVVHEATIKKQEFQPFLKKWGVTNLKFESANEDAKLIYVLDSNDILGFSVPFKNAEIFFLPFIRNYPSNNDLKDGLETLIDNLLTYIAKSRIDLPDWAKESSFFSDEKPLLREKSTIQSKLTKIETELRKFDEAKSLLFHNEHHLEITLPNFLKTHLGLEIEQKETYKEDFWIIDDKKEKQAIAEIKSKTKGFTKGLVGYLIAHRDYYELEDDFPALLFVNCNLQAGRWKDKEKPLNKQEYTYVANQNVLVIRLEDVVRLWEMKTLGKITSEEILTLFLTKKGWLQVNAKLEIHIHPK